MKHKNTYITLMVSISQNTFETFHLCPLEIPYGQHSTICGERTRKSMSSQRQSTQVFMLEGSKCAALTVFFFSILTKLGGD